MASAGSFYGGLAGYYHLLFQDWDAAVRTQGRAVDRLIARALGAGPRRVLDAACGIGTQALGLALCGHAVTGSDLSEAALARAGREAARLGVALPTRAADLGALSRAVSGRFEVVVALDNALAHLPDQAALEAALREMAAVLEPGGLLMASIRDYDRLAAERPRLESSRVIDGASGRRVLFQVWDWDADGGAYGLTQYIVRHGADGIETLAFATRMRAVTRADVGAALAAAGLRDAAWIEPEADGFYQPVVIARR